MNIIFTLCSNNYLPQAKVLADSVIRCEPSAKMVVGLVDIMTDDVDYSIFNAVEILPVHSIGILDFDTLWKKYNIIELNTAVKPFYIQYFFKDSSVENVIYFDPDIMLFSNLDTTYQALKLHDIVITPHIYTPIPIDDKKPFENLFLIFGIYNLGFIAIKNTENSHNMLKWWGDRTYHFGYFDLKNGFFVDQLWINLVPILFENVKILHHYGYNAAPWNLHERFFEKNEQEYYLQNGEKLVFFSL